MTTGERSATNAVDWCAARLNTVGATAAVLAGPNDEFFFGPPNALIPWPSRRIAGFALVLALVVFPMQPHHVSPPHAQERHSSRSMWPSAQSDGIPRKHPRGSRQGCRENGSRFSVRPTRPGRHSPPSPGPCGRRQMYGSVPAATIPPLQYSAPRGGISTTSPPASLRTLAPASAAAARRRPTRSPAGSARRARSC